MHVETLVLVYLFTLSLGMPSAHLPRVLDSRDPTSKDERHTSRQDDPWANPLVSCTGNFFPDGAPYVEIQDGLVNFFTGGGVIDNLWVRNFDDVVFETETFACRYGDADAPSDGSWQGVWSLIDAQCNQNGQIGTGWARSDAVELTLGRDLFDASIC